MNIEETVQLCPEDPDAPTATLYLRETEKGKRLEKLVIEDDRCEERAGTEAADLVSFPLTGTIHVLPYAVVLPRLLGRDVESATPE